jgi:hypothetical protein
LIDGLNRDAEAMDSPEDTRSQTNAVASRDELANMGMRVRIA